MLSTNVVFILLLAMNEFIQKFVNSFEDPNSVEADAKTKFRDLEAWSSMMALIIIAMIDADYGVSISAEEMKSVSTIQELYDLTQAKIQ